MGCCRNKKSAFLRKDSGVVIVEFLYTLPLFLFVSIMAIEFNFMWADKHILQLASFEASRSLVQSDPEFDHEGNFISSPCERPEALKSARSTAISRIAIIAPPIEMELLQIEAFAPQLIRDTLVKPVRHTLASLRSAVASISAGAARLASRWPTALLATELNCEFDPGKELVTVEVIYNRRPKVPMVGQLVDILNTMLPGISSKSWFSSVSALLGSPLDWVGSDYLDSSISSIPAVNASLSTLMESLVHVEGALEKLNGGRIALKSKTSLTRQFFEGDTIFNDDMVAERDSAGWRGHLKGIINLHDNGLLPWARKLSAYSEHIRKAEE